MKFTQQTEKSNLRSSNIRAIGLEYGRRELFNGPLGMSGFGYRALGRSPRAAEQKRRV